MPPVLLLVSRAPLDLPDLIPPGADRGRSGMCDDMLSVSGPFDWFTIGPGGDEGVAVAEKILFARSYPEGHWYWIQYHYGVVSALNALMSCLPDSGDLLVVGDEVRMRVDEIKGRIAKGEEWITVPCTEGHAILINEGAIDLNRVNPDRARVRWRDGWLDIEGDFGSYVISQDDRLIDDIPDQDLDRIGRRYTNPSFHVLGYSSPQAASAAIGHLHAVPELLILTERECLLTRDDVLTRIRDGRFWTGLCAGGSDMTKDAVPEP